MPMKEKKPYKGRVVTQREIREKQGKNQARMQVIGNNKIKKFVPFRK